MSSGNAVCAATLAMAVALPSAVPAATMNYFASISALNESGVNGTALLKVDTQAQTLGVRLIAFGLEPDMLHVQHIHGRFGPDGSPRDSVRPTASSDLDGDGFIELAEALPDYGPIVLNLKDPDVADPLGGFPTAPDGVINFRQTYDLSGSPAFASNVLTPDPDDSFTASDLLPLDLREIVIHGLTLPMGAGANGGEADGTGGFKPTLPVAAGEIQVGIAPIPLPAGVWLMGAALGALGLFGFRRSRAEA